MTRENPRIRPPEPDFRSYHQALIYQADLDEWWSAFVQKELDRYRDVVGSALDDYLGSVDAAIAGLRHPTSVFREAALYVLDNVFPRNINTVQACERLIETEPDDAVKVAALGYIAAHYRGSKDPVCATRFARFVNAENESVQVRKFAYWCLLLLLHGPHLRASESFESLRYPDEIDWRMVRKYAESSGT